MSRVSYTMMRNFFVLFCVVAFSDAHKILVYNVRFGHSHSNFMGNIADILAEAGHNVTSLIPIVNEDTKDVTTKSSHYIYVPTSEKVKAESGLMASARSSFFANPIISFPASFFISRFFGAMFANQCRATLDHPGLIEELTKAKYDVVIAEHFDMCGVGISHVISPRVLISCTASTLFGQQYEEAGVPSILSYDPSPYTSVLNPHSFVSRAWNIIGDYAFRWLFYYTRASVEELFREKYGPDFPSLTEISSRSAYFLTNAEPLIDYAHPTLHKVIDIGGIGAREPKPLDKEWEEVMTRRASAVLISFGSVAESKHLAIEAKRAILKTVARFPAITFIWKYELPEDDFAVNEAAKVDNLVLTKWQPQNDLLNHPRMAAFISHGGMGSTTETARRGVPGVFIPIFGDQPRNAGMIQHNGIGKVFDKFDLTNDEKLSAALREILEDESYRTNARRVARKLANKPYAARDLLVKHVEFAAEFGASPSLRPAAFDLNFVEYYNVDIIVVSAAVVLFAVYVVASISRCILRKCCGSSVTVKKSKQS